MKKLIAVVLIFSFIVSSFALTATANEEREYIYFFSYATGDGRFGNATFTTKNSIEDYEKIRGIQNSLGKEIGSVVVIINFQLLKINKKNGESAEYRKSL